MYHRHMKRYPDAKTTIILVFMFLSMLFSILIPIFLASQALTGG
jgi:hypothetical protein